MIRFPIASGTSLSPKVMGSQMKGMVVRVDREARTYHLAEFRDQLFMSFRY